MRAGRFAGQYSNFVRNLEEYCLRQREKESKISTTAGGFVELGGQNMYAGCTE